MPSAHVGVVCELTWPQVKLVDDLPFCVGPSFHELPGFAFLSDPVADPTLVLFTRLIQPQWVDE